MYLLQEKLRLALSGAILITGHTGFKGTWLTLLLEKMGIPTIGYSLPPIQDSLYQRANRLGAIPEIFADIRDLNEVERFLATYKPSAIIHLAAQPLVLESYKKPLDTFETNVMGTANILSAAFNISTIRAVVAATTDKVYRNDNLGKPFTETDPLSGKDPYSASKVGSEAAIAAWQNISNLSGGPKVVSVRAGNVIGGGDWAENRIMPDLVRGFTSNQPIQIRNPDSTRPWQHVLDPLHGYLLTLQSLLEDVSIDSINFGPSEKSLQVREVVNLSLAEWPTFPPELVTYEEKLSLVESKNLNLSSTKAKNTLGWKESWTQQEAVISTMRWWRRVYQDGFSAEKSCSFDIDHLLAKNRC